MKTRNLATPMDMLAGAVVAGRPRYRYDQLTDALAQARVTGAQPTAEAAVHGQHGPRPMPAPAEQALMASLGIQFDGCAFRFAGYRYERLADALVEARRAMRGEMGARS